MPDISQQELIDRQERLQQQGFQQQMAMQELQERAHQQQQLMMGLSSIEKGSDDVLKSIANNLK
jgi:hypothetical protein